MGCFKLSNEINKDILLKLKNDDNIDDNIKKFIFKALELEYKFTIEDNKTGTFKKNYLNLIDKFIDE